MSNTSYYRLTPMLCHYIESNTLILFMTVMYLCRIIPVLTTIHSYTTITTITIILIHCYNYYDNHVPMHYYYYWYNHALIQYYYCRTYAAYGHVRTCVGSIKRLPDVLTITGSTTTLFTAYLVIALAISYQ